MAFVFRTGCIIAFRTSSQVEYERVHGQQPCSLSPLLPQCRTRGGTHFWSHIQYGRRFQTPCHLSRECPKYDRVLAEDLVDGHGRLYILATRSKHDKVLKASLEPSFKLRINSNIHPNSTQWFQAESIQLKFPESIAGTFAESSKNKVHSWTRQLKGDWSKLRRKANSEKWRLK